MCIYFRPRLSIPTGWGLALLNHFTYHSDRISCGPLSPLAAFERGCCPNFFVVVSTVPRPREDVGVRTVKLIFYVKRCAPVYRCGTPDEGRIDLRPPGRWYTRPMAGSDMEKSRELLQRPGSANL